MILVAVHEKLCQQLMFLSEIFIFIFVNHRTTHMSEKLFFRRAQGFVSVEETLSVPCELTTLKSAHCVLGFWPRGEHMGA
jgi:hypothetical protein